MKKRCKNPPQNVYKLNPTIYKNKLYTTNKWDLSEVCKSTSTIENQLI